MKHTIYFLLLISFTWACNQQGKEEQTTEDSLQYYPPTPAPLEKNEFREYYRRLTAYFDSTLLRSNFSGQVIVAKNGSVIYEKYAGRPDLRRKDSMTASTSLHIASTSKTFTGIAVLRLIQEGKLSLQDSLSRFFPAFPYKGITIKMLLNHRSGLPNYVNFMDKTSWDQKKYCTNADVLALMISEPPNKEAQPDRKFSYCNTNYILLALIIEKITGKTYPVYMKEKFFVPLQMKDTYVFTMQDSLTATPTFSPSGTYWDFDFLDGTYGDKNVYTTARDLLKWDQALYTDQLISKDLLDSAFTPYSNERPSIHNYGLGFRLLLMPNGKKIVYHFGRWHGANAAFARLPDEKAVIIILGNRFTRSIYNAAHHCYDIFGEYFGKEGTDDAETENTTEKKPAAPGKNIKSQR